MKEVLLAQFNRSIDAITAVRDQLDQIESICDQLIGVLRQGGTIYTAGNGGSATHAFHLAEELIGRYRTDRRPLRAICLNADPTTLTCIANDFGFETVFARQCEALLTSADALCIFSTSGNSPNLLRALHAAKSAESLSVGFLGRDGGAALAHCDQSMVIPVNDSAAVQDCHHIVLHLVCEAVEAVFCTETH